VGRVEIARSSAKVDKNNKLEELEEPLQKVRGLFAQQTVHAPPANLPH
jgi:hypothetical protein